MYSFKSYRMFHVCEQSGQTKLVCEFFGPDRDTLISLEILDGFPWSSWSPGDDPKIVLDHEVASFGFQWNINCLT